MVNSLGSHQTATGFCVACAWSSSVCVVFHPQSTQLLGLLWSYQRRRVGRIHSVLVWPLITGTEPADFFSTSAFTDRADWTLMYLWSCRLEASNWRKTLRVKWWKVLQVQRSWKTEQKKRLKLSGTVRRRRPNLGTEPASFSRGCFDACFFMGLVFQSSAIKGWWSTFVSGRTAWMHKCVNVITSKRGKVWLWHWYYRCICLGWGQRWYFFFLWAGLNPWQQSLPSGFFACARRREERQRML